GTAWIMSHSMPFTSGKETRYGSVSGQGPSIRNGKLAARVDAGMISVCISVPGYAPAIVGLKEAKPGETLDLGTITVKRGFTWKLTIRNESDQPVPKAELAAIPRFGNTPIKFSSDAMGEAQLTQAVEDEYTF